MGYPRFLKGSAGYKALEPAFAANGIFPAIHFAGKEAAGKVSASRRIVMKFCFHKLLKIRLAPIAKGQSFFVESLEF